MKKTVFPPSLKFISRIIPNPQSENDFFTFHIAHFNFEAVPKVKNDKSSHPMNR